MGSMETVGRVSYVAFLNWDSYLIIATNSIFT